ncbi:MAG: hypothetical protein CSA64_04475 [Arachnia propionica]|nr:MAG: hypothetical protein CSA64_04475 [Arachnia propionica]
MADTTRGIRMEVGLRMLPQHSVISETGRVTADQLHEFIASAIDRLKSTARAVDSPYVTYYSPVSPRQAGDVEVCLPVAPTVIDPRSRREVPATKFAFTRIVKGMSVYPHIISAYEAVEAWAAANSMDLAGPGIEIYFANLRQVKDDDLAVDVGFPVR